jgi:hypothetical protein
MYKSTVDDEALPVPIYKRDRVKEIALGVFFGLLAWTLLFSVLYGIYRLLE